MNVILPIGSVVRIKGIKKKIMIFGYLQKCWNSKVDHVDYVGIPYPEGNLGPQVQLGFQRTDIVEVLFEGYRTEEFEPWRELLVYYGNEENRQNFAKDEEETDQEV